MDRSSLPLAAIAFMLSAWAVIGNDALQTLGPFLQANRGRTPRPLQALYLCLILCAVLLLGWWQGGGDVSWGRLDAYPPRPSVGWLDLLPPLAVLLLTQLGAPVSTSFLVLTAFSPANLPALLRRSLHGYGLALAVALLAYGAMALSRRRAVSGAPPTDLPAAAGMSLDPPGEPRKAAAGPGGDPVEPAGSTVHANSPGRRTRELQVGPQPMAAWMATALLLQWIATGWLWSQWLIQDLANIFITLPRQLGGGAMALCLAVLCVGVCLLLSEGGGAIQAILRRKSGLEDPQANTVLSLLYGVILAVLAAWGREPLSTTWVFLGMLAGRELGLRLAPEPRPLLAVALDLGRDLALASLGLAISLGVALAVQPLRPAS